MELTTQDEIRHARAALASGNADALDRLVWTGVFSADAGRRDAARATVLEQCQAAGIYPASIHDLYTARGRGEVAPTFTVPAINIRGMAYDTARALFRVQKAMDAGAVLCEIARSEITYTDQRPSEYVFVVLAAALREGWAGPVFIQGDHFQMNAKKYLANPEVELNAVKQLTAEALAAGFYNIDIDTSTLVDLSKSTIEEQQGLNGGLCAELTAFIRAHEPEGVTVSVGGEIGEVGGKNSTPDELNAFMSVYRAALERQASGLEGISKISVQTGTSHGGIPLPDGKVADVKLDFDTLQALSKLARERYGLAGAVQHGASTLPGELFDQFPKRGACEIHLATEFQNMIYEHPSFPAELRRAIYEWLGKNAAEERKPTDTDEQFFYKTRKKALGPFKQQMWGLPANVRAEIGATLEQKFTALLGMLNVRGTRAVARQHAPLVAGSFPKADAAVAAGGPEDIAGLHD
jgi:fructose/tagatose bisphosphate aldolase